MSTTKANEKLPRNYEIAPGVLRFSKARMFHKRGLWEKLKKPFQKQEKKVETQEKYIVKKIGGDKNGGERKILVQKPPKLLPQVPQLLKRNKRKTKKVPLRKSITPGTILIILVGRHRGKRVVFLKQLEKSGLLLVTGPLKLNACPLRRIAQSFVIATKTKLDVSKLQVPEHIDDDYLKRKSNKVADKSKGGIFADGAKQYEVSQQRKTDQKAVDAGVLDAIRAHPDKKYLFGYLGSRFHLAKGMYPHKMTF
uniref:Large ribosomal subunit protein eL6 n=1 Tax=Meloidogyne enterolobii TaxID=390850 RepID=A0A6V7Y7M2_MELEN|nr:unnamed protein product [Meloidogyne enterolobii]